jgi:DNA-directed RNA polymerase specialized sigma24 family protein
VFITIGPYHATGSPSGLPDTEEKDRLRLARLVPRGASASPSQALIRNELCERLRAALDQLAPHDKEILVMRNLEQLPIAEIAEVWA